MPEDSNSEPVDAPSSAATPDERGGAWALLLVVASASGCVAGVEGFVLMFLVTLWAWWVGTVLFAAGLRGWKDDLARAGLVALYPALLVGSWAGSQGVPLPIVHVLVVPDWLAIAVTSAGAIGIASLVLRHQCVPQAEPATAHSPVAWYWAGIAGVIGLGGLAIGQWSGGKAWVAIGMSAALSFLVALTQAFTFARQPHESSHQRLALVLCLPWVGLCVVGLAGVLFFTRPRHLLQGALLHPIPASVSNVQVESLRRDLPGFASHVQLSFTIDPTDLGEFLKRERFELTPTLQGITVTVLHASRIVNGGACEVSAEPSGRVVLTQYTPDRFD